MMNPQFLQGIKQGLAEAPRRGEVFPVTMRPSSAGCNRGSFLQPAQGRAYHGPVFRGYAQLLHQKLKPVYLGFFGKTLADGARGVVIPAYDLLLGRPAHNLVIGNAVTGHVYAHVGRALVWGLPLDLFKDGIKNREYLNIPVVADGCRAVSFEIEGVDHIDIVKVGCCRLIGQIDGMLQRKIPDGECFEFRIPGLFPCLCSWYSWERHTAIFPLPGQERLPPPGS